MMSARARATILAVLCCFLIGFTSIAQDGQIVRETIDEPSLEGNRHYWK